MRYIEHPHLPRGKVRLCAVGTAYTEVARELERAEISVVQPRPYIALPRPIQSHADLLLHHAGGNQLWMADRGDAALRRTLQESGYQVHDLKKALSKQYPADVALNCFVLGNALYGNERAIDAELLKYYHEQGREAVDIRQGYAKCSVCIVDENSLITADSGIAKAAEARGLNTLLIRPGTIRLPGYSYGFIGGCGGLLAANRLAFIGDIRKHPDYPLMERFCASRGVEVTCLCADWPLTDIGGILPLMEA